MNNIKKYIKNIWTIMPMHTKKEKFYVSELKKHLNEYLDDHPQCSYDDIVQQFGEPKDIVVEYIQSSDLVNLHTASVRLRKRMGKQTMRCMACSWQQEDGEILEIKNRRFL